MRVVSHPNPDHPSQSHLWLLVGGDDDDDRSTAYYLGPDRDADGRDLATETLTSVITRNLLNLVKAHEALADYRAKVL